MYRWRRETVESEIPEPWKCRYFERRMSRCDRGVEVPKKVREICRYGRELAHVGCRKSSVEICPPPTAFVAIILRPLLSPLLPSLLLTSLSSSSASSASSLPLAVRLLSPPAIFPSSILLSFAFYLASAGDFFLVVLAPVRQATETSIDASHRVA